MKDSRLQPVALVIPLPVRDHLRMETLEWSPERRIPDIEKEDPTPARRKRLTKDRRRGNLDVSAETDRSRSQANVGS